MTNTYTIVYFDKECLPMWIIELPQCTGCAEMYTLAEQYMPQGTRFYHCAVNGATVARITVA